MPHLTRPARRALSALCERLEFSESGPDQLLSMRRWMDLKPADIPKDVDRYTKSALKLDRERTKRIADLYEGPLELREAAQEKDRQECAGSPLTFIDRWARIPLPKRPPHWPFADVALKMFPIQRDYVQWLDEQYRRGEDGIAAKSREMGATHLAMLYLLWRWLFHPPFLAKVLSRKERIVDDQTTDSLFGQMRWHLEQLPPHIRPRRVASTKDIPRTGYHDSSMRLIHGNGSTITGDATTGDAGRGARGGIVLFDEFAHVDPTLQRMSWASLETVARCRIPISTPLGGANKFAELARTLAPRQVFRMPWSGNLYRTPEWYDGLLIENGGTMARDEREQEFNVGFGGVHTLRILSVSDSGLYTDADLFAEHGEAARESLPVIGGMDFGSGPSWTVLVLLLADYSRPTPVLWADLCLAWEREPADSIAAGALQSLAAYRGAHRIYGDPAGDNAESDQESWFSRLNAAGLGIESAGAWLNTEQGIELNLSDVNRALDEGTLRIHRERAAILYAALQQWQYAAPAGVDPALLTRSQLKPRKDRHSHCGDALRYAVGRGRALQAPTGRKLDGMRGLINRLARP